MRLSRAGAGAAAVSGAEGGAALSYDEALKLAGWVMEEAGRMRRLVLERVRLVCRLVCRLVSQSVSQLIS